MGSESRFTEWIVTQRRRSGGGGWTTLGSIVPRDYKKRTFETDVRLGRVPRGFERIDLSAVVISSSITVVIAQFTLLEESQEFAGAILARDVGPGLRKVDGKWQALYPDSHRQLLIDDSWSRLVAAASFWMSKRLPGAFAGQGAELPSMTPFLTSTLDPVGTDRPTRSVLDALQANGFPSYLSDEGRGPLRLSLPNEPFIKHHSRYVLSGRTGDIFPQAAWDHRGLKKAEGLYRPSARDVAGLLGHDYLRPLFSRIALRELLDLHQQRLAVARDEASRMHGHRVVRSTKALRRSLLSLSLDISSYSQEVIEFAENLRWYRYNVMDFEVSGSYREQLEERGAPLGIAEQFAAQQAATAKRLQRSEEELREVLSITATANSTISNVWLQRWALVVAIISAIAAVVAIVVSLKAKP